MNASVSSDKRVLFAIDPCLDVLKKWRSMAIWIESIYLNFSDTAPQAHCMAVVLPTQEDIRALDQALWTFKDLSFIPHVTDVLDLKSIKNPSIFLYTSSQAPHIFLNDFHWLLTTDPSLDLGLHHRIHVMEWVMPEYRNAMRQKYLAYKKENLKDPDIYHP